MANRLQDLTGSRFGRLVVTGGRTADENGDASWECLCDCGRHVRARMAHLKKGNTRSCGCLASEHAAKNGRASRKHGLGGTAEYRIWSKMHARCGDPSDRGYVNYGGRGITVCPEWQSVERFVADMGKRPSQDHEIDRIDNNKGYSPDNCRWATRKENQRNRRCNATVEKDGRMMTIAQAAEETGINYTTIHFRLQKGLREETGLFAPPKK